MISSLFLNIPGCAVAAGLAVLVVLGVILHDWAEGRHGRGAQVELGRGDLAAEAG